MEDALRLFEILEPMLSHVLQIRPGGALLTHAVAGGPGDEGLAAVPRGE